MPTHNQQMVEPVATVRDMGRSDTATTQASFPASPIFTGDITDDERREQFQTLVLDGQVNDEGHTFGTFNRDYAEAPNMEDVETGGGGLPGTPYLPNPVSPGPGSINPADIADPPDGLGANPNEGFGTGVGSQLSPSDSSAAQSAGTLGDYTLGKAWGTGS